MTVQVIDGMTELYVPYHPRLTWPLSYTSITVNAATEAAHFCGRAWLPARTGTKTISAAGSGKIHWPLGAITWANSSTRLRVGVQPLATSTSPLHGTGTFSVYHELIPGTDTLSSNTWATTTMSSGTMDITHNEEICIAIDMTVLGGADSIVVRVPTTTQINYPGVTAVTSGPTYTGQTAVPNAIIEFDDGTFGFINTSFVTSGTLTNVHSLSNASNPDEYCNILQFPGAIKVDGLFCVVDNNTNAEFELILYSDPEGTPVAERTITVDADMVNTTSARPFYYPLDSVYSVASATKIGVAIRPTTATSLDIPYMDVAVAGQMVAHPLGTNGYQGHRQNQTGAFTTTTTRRIYAGVSLSGMSDDSAVGGSGGGMRIVGPGGLAG